MDSVIVELCGLGRIRKGRTNRSSGAAVEGRESHKQLPTRPFSVH